MFRQIPRVRCRAHLEIYIYGWVVPNYASMRGPKSSGHMGVFITDMHGAAGQWQQCSAVSTCHTYLASAHALASIFAVAVRCAVRVFIRLVSGFLIAKRLGRASPPNTPASTNESGSPAVFPNKVCVLRLCRVQRCVSCCRAVRGIFICLHSLHTQVNSTDRRLDAGLSRPRHV